MTNKELEKKVNELTELVMKVVEAMPKKEDSIPLAITPQVDLPPQKTTGLPAPSTWRAKVDEILGKSFEIEVVDGAKGDYLMKIYMPEGIERRPGGERIGRDLSQAIIHRATDLFDVESWCKKIQSNILLTHSNLKFPL